MIVKVPSTYLRRVRVPHTTVTIADDGAVTWGDKVIGYVWKGTRTYSPPTHRGSPIARYHRTVTEWQGGPRPRATREHADSRRDILQRLIADAIAAEGKTSV